MTLLDYMNSQFSAAQNLDFCLRVVIAAVFGGILGFERSRRFKSAGVRTHIVVCCTACLMMIVSKYGFADLTGPDGASFNGTRGADSARIAAQVVSGISFLCAGVIFKDGGSIKGHRIDVAFDSHEEALAFGRRDLEIIIIEET